MKKLMLKNCLIKNAYNIRQDLKDIIIENGFITDIGQNLKISENIEIINCVDKIILPGMFDLHSHLREPGYEYKETILSGAKAALHGGITGLLAMPNTNPAVDSDETVDIIKSIIEKNIFSTVHICAAITKGRKGQELTDIKKLQEFGVKFFSDDGNCVMNSMIMKKAMEEIKECGAVLASHSEDENLSAGGCINAGKRAIEFNLKGMPAAAEEIMIERDLRLAEITGARIHIQHISTAESCEIVKRYKEKGVNVTAEATPHHLIFSEDDIENEYDTNLKVNPPLRKKVNCEKLIECIKNGVIDCIVTDHAPHSETEKKSGFISAPFGINGFETALISLYHFFIKNNLLSWQDIIKCFSVNPRKIAGLRPVEIKIGEPAEIVIFDENKKTTFDKKYFVSKSFNTPFLEKTLDGRIEKIIFRDLY